MFTTTYYNKLFLRSFRRSVARSSIADFKWTCTSNCLGNFAEFSLFKIIILICLFTLLNKQVLINEPWQYCLKILTL